MTWTPRRQTPRAFPRPALFAGLAALLTAGCQKDPPPAKVEAPAPKPVYRSLLSFHAAGANQVLSDTNSASLRRVLELPETTAIRSNATAKIAVAASRLISEKSDVATGAALLQPLIEDLAARESFVSCQAAPDGSQQVWSGGVMLDAPALTNWQAAIPKVLAWSSNTFASITVAGVSAMQIPWSGQTLRVANAGNWLVWSFAAGEDTALSGLVQSIQKEGRPRPAAAGYWVRAEADLEGLSWAAPTPVGGGLSKLTLNVSGQKGRITTAASFQLKADPALKLEPWNIPTNAIHDPIISFTAGQGLDRWASTWSIPTNVVLPKLSSQFFVWARPDVAFMTSMASPAVDATNSLVSLASGLIPATKTAWDGMGVGGLLWLTNQSELAWRGLPVIIPHVKPHQEPSGEFYLGGLFPVTKAFTNPAPAELLGQVSGRTNLVYYDWEITEDRLAQWAQIFQFVSIVSARPKFDANSVGTAWLRALAPVLGNTVTEVTQESPKSFALTRRSESGFTGIELNFLAQWLEETNFPSAAFRMPFQPVGFAAPPPVPGGGTNRVRKPRPAGPAVPGLPTVPTKPVRRPDPE